MTIRLADKPTIVVDGPADPSMAQLWQLAISKFQARAGHAPATRDELREVTADYQQLTTKARGSVGAIVGRLVREHCAEERRDGG